MRRLLYISLVWLMPLPAMAIYKCESNRAVSYSDIPCSSGTSSTLETSFNTISPAPASTDQQLARQKTELKRLEAARHKREEKEDKEQRQAAKVAAAKQKKCAGLAQRRKWSDEDAALATGKAGERARLKAKRMSEKYMLECTP